jgi:glycine/D-amino acid oxidase-like deaminating enzyme
MTKQKYLIIGAGLSGIATGIHLVKNGHLVTMLDSGENFSSAVAAGQINPLVFRRMTKSWRVDDFLPYAEIFYNSLSKETSLPIYFPIHIRRMFSSAHERVMWLEKENKEGFSQYMEKITSDDDSFNLAQNDFGSARIKKSSYVHASNFLKAGKIWLEKHATLLHEKLNYSDIDPILGNYKGETFDQILFCEGSENTDNPWFHPFIVEHTKGEVLTIKSNEINELEALNRKCFLLPIGDQLFRLGATYRWNTPEKTITEEARIDLLEKLQLLNKKPFEVVEQQVGIRPTTPDRRPIIGAHPEFSKLLIFNGLGAKGYLMAPLLAKEFVAFLEGKGELDTEVRIERLVKK